MSSTQTIECVRCRKWAMLIATGHADMSNAVAALRGQLSAHLQESHGLGSDTAGLEATGSEIKVHEGYTT